MALESFDFPFHGMPETVNPESGFRGQFGGSYLFAAAPDSPDQRTFKLSFEGMQYFFDGNDAVDATINPQRNMKALIDFYQTHKLHVSFNYNHPLYGELVVKFNKPLPEPSTKRGGYGVVDDFEVELVEIP